MILLWDVDAGLAQIDKYFHLSDSHIIAGALLGVGIVNCGIKNDCDPVSSINYSSLHGTAYDLELYLHSYLTYFLRHWHFWVIM
jgi:hypothetical protein